MLSLVHTRTGLTQPSRSDVLTILNSNSMASGIEVFVIVSLLYVCVVQVPGSRQHERKFGERL
jgi:hypothetical protein